MRQLWLLLVAIVKPIFIFVIAWSLPGPMTKEVYELTETMLDPLFVNPWLTVNIIFSCACLCLPRFKK